MRPEVLMRLHFCQELLNRDQLVLLQMGKLPAVALLNRLLQSVDNLAPFGRNLYLNHTPINSAALAHEVLKTF
jgi:hypothetical protein